MKALFRLLLAIGIAASLLAVSPPAPAEASHNSCNPHAQGDDLRNWPVGLGCRNFVYDPGPGNLMSRADLLALESLYTSPKAGFTRNFLWYSEEKQVTVSDQSVKWASCRIETGPNQRCADGDIVADYFATPHDPGRGAVLRAYDWPSSITFSAFEYNGMWIAKACGNWKDAPDRPKPVPHIDGIKFRDDNRNGIRQSSEIVLQGWDIEISRVRSDAGQSTGLLTTVTTDANGYYRFDLDGHGPGRYRVEELPQAGWTNYTPIAYEIEIEFGVGDRKYTRDFGNAETIADVAKTHIKIVDPPTNLDVNTPTDLDVEVTIENHGPAEEVPVRDVLVADVPPDCVATPASREFETVLKRNQPETRTLTFMVTCSNPSEHVFRFNDVLSITRSDILDNNPNNDTASTSETIPVHAYTDIGATAALICDPSTVVDTAATCTADITLANNGFGPVDATVVAQLAMPQDCVSVPSLATIPFEAMADGSTTTLEQVFEVTCSHRSFHEIELSVAHMPDDPHVFDTNPANDIAGDGPSIIEVFHDASMAAIDVHLVCDEQIGDTTFTCTADVDYIKTGPAPNVDVILWAELDPVTGCTASPGNRQEHGFVLSGSQTQAHTFSWTMNCVASDTLRSFKVTTDINPSADEPHAVDEPGPIMDTWVVPYCLPTVNPHGKKEPQAPGGGSAMNEDGFYIFGALPAGSGEQVMIRDDGSGVVFGPFDDGTRIKWVEANGAEPSITPMGSNNGNGNGQANAVDYQITAQGDAQAFYIDEKGVEVSVTCLVPPFPQ